MSRIHLIQNYSKIERVEGTIWESGDWAIGEGTADRLIGGSVYFHSAQATPSFFGGKIMSWRHQTKDKYEGRIVLRFDASPSFKGTLAGRGGWSREKKIVLDE